MTRAWISATLRLLRPAALVASCLAALGCAGFAAYEVVEAPGNQLFGATLVRGAPTVREVALTYDDGPNPPYTDRILDVLRSEHVPATFFLVGRAVVAYPQTVRRIVREGHVIGNHSWDHAHLIVETNAAVRTELSRTDAAIERVAGVRPDLMRPPFGARDFAVIDQAHALGYRVVMWSVPLAADWEQPGDATIAARVLAHITDGSIIVLHDGNRGILCGRGRPVPPRVCDREQDVAATRTIIERLRTRGYRFVTIPQLIAAAGSGRGHAYRLPRRSMNPSWW
ncbi:MAG: polysaccharide deacetylase family protein [Candidatus Eremiobacteraeota bacterium]|nr:polysaccharide deacetylase family protein [Candidatus Eremiobacteraeota bacterium]MBC5802991.1 polysaccharide deacetylase family protein [Candidatus Eremiobacteraeota bacterium]MBC5823165.1 polysaccharide deacetylase family protein [Candidatus Eremiobacteraeota bacterium]